MRAVVIGGAGFLGSHLMDYLVEKKYDTLCLDRPGCDRRYPDRIGVPFRECDIRVPGAAAEHISEGDYVFHLAAYLGKAKVSEEEYRALNVEAAAEVCRAAVEKKAARFIFPSSLAAMGPVGTPEKPMTEDTECAPVTLYGRTKLEAERKIEALAEGRMDCVIFRPPPFFGPRMNRITSSWILFDKMKKKSITLVGDTQNYFPLCYVKNLARGMADLAEKSPGGIDTYIIADGPPVRFIDILTALRNQFGVNEKIVSIPYGFARSVASGFEFLGKTFRFTPLLTTDIVDGMAKSFYVYDISKILSAGYTPAFTLEEGIRETAGWMESPGGP